MRQQPTKLEISVTYHEELSTYSLEFGWRCCSTVTQSMAVLHFFSLRLGLIPDAAQLVRIPTKRTLGWSQTASNDIQNHLLHFNFQLSTFNFNFNYRKDCSGHAFYTIGSKTPPRTSMKDVQTNYRFYLQKTHECLLQGTQT